MLTIEQVETTHHLKHTTQARRYVFRVLSADSVQTER